MFEQIKSRRRIKNVSSCFLVAIYILTISPDFADLPAVERWCWLGQGCSTNLCNQQLRIFKTNSNHFTRCTKETHKETSSLSCPMSPLIFPVSPIDDNSLRSWYIHVWIHTMIVSPEIKSLFTKSWCFFWTEILTVKWPSSCCRRRPPRMYKDRPSHPSLVECLPTHLLMILAQQLH